MSGQSEKKTLAIVGLGLIGASIAEATRKRYPDWHIIGVSKPETIKEALSLKLIDEGFGYDQVRQAIEQCDLAFLCAPIDNILNLLQEFIENPLQLKPGAIISDVGSTKREICVAGQKAFPSGEFVGSHPMAGSEKTGLKSRDSHLFENATWTVCVNEKASRVSQQVTKLTQFITDIGARLVFTTPDEHDRAVAVSSHLPQLLSTTLAVTVLHYELGWIERVLQVVGGGFRDMARLAKSSFVVWRPIIRTNRDNIQEVLRRYITELERLHKGLSSDDLGATFFVTADKMREFLNAPRKGFSSPTTEILVDLEDKSGALLAALKPLSDAGINILDLEILKVREGEEGVLMMGFRKPEEAQSALDLLAKSGHKARLR